MQAIWRWRPVKLWRIVFHYGAGMAAFYGWRLFVQLGPLHLYAWPCKRIVEIIEKGHRR